MRSRRTLQDKYPLEDSWLFTSKPTQPVVPFCKNPSERSFVVESFDKESGRADCQLTFMNPNMFKKPKPPQTKVHNMSTLSQKTEKTDTHSQSFFRLAEKKKANINELLEKSRKQKDAYIKRILSISVDHKKRRLSSNKKEQPYRKSESKLPRTRVKSTLRSCCNIDTPTHGDPIRTIPTPKSKQTMASTNKQNNMPLNETVRMLARKQQLENELKEINTSLLMKKRNRKKPKT